MLKLLGFPKYPHFVTLSSLKGVSARLVGQVAHHLEVTNTWIVPPDNSLIRFVGGLRR